MSVIEWTKEKRDRLEKVYKSEIANGSGRYDTFTFEGHEFVIGYAEYLIQHLNTELKDASQRPNRRVRSV